MNLGVIHQEAGDLAQARAAYEKALEISPDLFEVLHNLAAVLDKQGSKEEAERIYTRILAKNPDLEDVWFRLGYLRLERGDSSRRRGSLPLACVAKRPDWIEAQLNLGICCWNMGDQDGASKAFEAVLAVNPDSLDALRGLAALAVEHNNLDQALEHQARLIEKGERSPELFYNTGLLLQKSGQLTRRRAPLSRSLAGTRSVPRGSPESGSRAQGPGPAGRGARLLETGARAEARTRRELLRQRQLVPKFAVLKAAI